MMSEKIQSQHLERAAYVYVRQSTMTQVRENLESQRRQYELAARAKELGFSEIVVVDEDLGISASGSCQRPGFVRLLAAVCQAEVGAVLALEASRLARNNRDWHHLIDLCALTDTLVIDLNGTYNPQHLDDRLLLGLKGTMSEFELGLLRQRAQEALRQMVERGEVLTELPTGYIRTEDNRCEITPDRQVQEAIRNIFQKFRELGSARQVLLWYQDQKLPLPRARPGSRGQEVEWRSPCYSTVHSVLKNPTYAGAFVYGRSRTRSRVVDGRVRKSSGHEVPREQWQVLLRDHHRGYISWKEYLENRRQLSGNLAMGGQSNSGAVRKGQALLAGLLRCARCGRKLHVAYSGSRRAIVRYHCRGGNINHGRPFCISFAGRKVDQAVSEAILGALAPAGIEAAELALREQEAAGREALRSLELALEKARYEAERARRQFDRVEPENRLVAAELEQRWEDALFHQREIESQLVAAASEQIDPPTEEDRQGLLELGSDLRQAWDHPAVSFSLKKRILRTVIQEIVADLDENSTHVQLKVHWAGGAHTALEVRKNRPGRHRRSTARKVVDLVAELVKVCDDQAITSLLNRLGYRTGAGNSWTAGRVLSLRQTNKIQAFDRSAKRTWITLQQAARSLQISEASTRRLLLSGVLPGQQVVTYAPWVIKQSNLELPEVQKAVAAIRSRRKLPSRNSEQLEILLETTS